MIQNETISNLLKQPAREINCDIEYINLWDETLYYFTNADALRSVSVERLPEAKNKFFGFGVTQKITVILVDTNREIIITKGDKLRVSAFAVDGKYTTPNMPDFFIDEIKRDENTNELTVIAYDALYSFGKTTVSELGLTAPYTLWELAEACQMYLGRGQVHTENMPANDYCFDEYFIPNFDGFETIKEVLTAIAEATQTIYYIVEEGGIVFKRLNIDGEADLIIDKDSYITLKNDDVCKLTHLVNSTDLGDNYEATLFKHIIDYGVTIEDADTFLDSQLISKNIFNPNLLPAFDLDNVSAWAGVYWDTNTVKQVFKPNTTYSARFIAEGVADIFNYSSVYDGKIGFALHDPETKQTTNICITNEGNTADILDFGEMVAATNTFTTPKDLYVGNYRLLVYTQRCLAADGTTPLLNKIRFLDFQIEEGEVVTPYTPYITDFSTISIDSNVSITQPNTFGVFTIPNGNDVVAISTDEVERRVFLDITYIAKSNNDGETQYIHNNPFFELNKDIVTLLDAAFGKVYGLNITQFDCEWRGNYLLDIGDKLEFITKDDNSFTSYLLDDVLEYNGGLRQKTSWGYEKANVNESTNNPTTLGESLKQTYAKVDKANKQIDILVSETNENKDAISNLQLTTSGINASVSAINKEVGTLANRVNAAITSEDVKIHIDKALSEGVDKVSTTTGFTFNEEGLSVSKTGSEMKTQITEDGMKVYKDNSEVLTVNNIGVNAENLHATTYLIIGNNSRIEDYNSDRSGCFWIG